MSRCKHHHQSTNTTGAGGSCREDSNRNRQSTRLPLSLTLSAAVLIASAALLAYSNSFKGVFVFDDKVNIVDNTIVRSLWPPWSLLWTTSDTTGIAGRPFVKLSFAVNYAVSGEEVWSYHTVNLLIHILAALALFGVVNRALSTVPLAHRYGRSAGVISFTCALLWILHPLQTQSVTYLSQRCESLMGLFFLGTVYFAMRSWQSPKPRWWQLLAAVSCLLGAGTKEVIVAVPLIVLMIEVVLLQRTFLGAIRTSALLYAGLCFSICALVLLVISGGTVGTVPREEMVPALGYVLTQPEVIAHYLSLTIWPNALCLDYAWPVASPLPTLPYVFAVGLVMALTVVALLRRHPASLLGLWFFAILAPTSLIPLPDLAFEHRMYLPLAAVLLLITVGGFECHRFLRERVSGWRQRAVTATTAVLILVAAIGLGWRTHLRNRDYHDSYVIWEKTVQQRPTNANALQNLARQMESRGRLPETITLLRRATLANPNHAAAHFYLARSLERFGETERAIDHYQKALQLKSLDPGWHNELALLLKRNGRPGAAIEHYKQAIRLQPDTLESAALYFNLGSAYEALARDDDAIGCYQRALELDPDHAPARSAHQRLRGSEPSAR
jgi:Flp pilus assembly protein TadD